MVNKHNFYNQRNENKRLKCQKLFINNIFALNVGRNKNEDDREAQRETERERERKRQKENETRQMKSKWIQLEILTATNCKKYIKKIKTK